MLEKEKGETLLFWREKWVKNGKIVVSFEAGQPKEASSGGEEGRAWTMACLQRDPLCSLPSGLPRLRKQMLRAMITWDQVASQNQPWVGTW